MAERVCGCIILISSEQICFKSKGPSQDAVGILKRSSAEIRRKDFRLECVCVGYVDACGVCVCVCVGF